MKAPLKIVVALELLGYLLVAAAAGVAAWTYVGPWAGLLAAGVVVVAVAWLVERNFTGSRGDSSTPRPTGHA